jgi:hypothetical protein
MEPRTGNPGRDDKVEGGGFYGKTLLGWGEPQVPPLRYAPVGMTILFGITDVCSQVKLSFRPERTRISCYAALTNARVCGFQRKAA